MIDLHNHILPAVDDGAEDMEESLEIGRQFVSEGVTQIAATPHLDPERRHGLPAREVEERVQQVQAALDRANIPLKVMPGTEVYLTPEVPELLQDGTIAALGTSRSVLVEISLLTDTPPIYLDDTLFKLELAGYQPVLAHPERYPFVIANPERARALAERGVTLQLTAPSLLGSYGTRVRRVAEQLLRQGLYTVAASDRHHPGPERSLAALRERLIEMGDEKLADLLLKTNPQRLLQNKTPLAADPLDSAGENFLSRFFRR